jgi:hypothetical protein
MKTGEKMRERYIEKKQLLYFLSTLLSEVQKEIDQQAGSDIYYQGCNDGRAQAYKQVIEWAQK